MTTVFTPNFSEGLGRQTLFTVNDVVEAMHLVHRASRILAYTPPSIAGTMRGLAKILNSHSWCACELVLDRHIVQLHRTLYCHRWSESQTADLKKYLNSIHADYAGGANQASQRFIGHANGSGSWHHLVSREPPRFRRSVLLAFSRRSEAFSRCESLLLDTFCALHPFDLTIECTENSSDWPTSPRQRQVLACLRGGKSEKQIANYLGLSRHTVHVYVKALYQRYGVNSRAELLSLSIAAANKCEV